MSAATQDCNGDLCRFQNFCSQGSKFGLKQNLYILSKSYRLHQWKFPYESPYLPEMESPMIRVKEKEKKKNLRVSDVE